MKSKIIARLMLMSAATTAAIVAAPATAEACGGFFCSSANLPVNQAAEKIIFAANGDGTVTAVIQILYQGPAPKFSWLLPIASVPKEGQIGVASNIAFQRLQGATNPQYNLTVRVEGTCNQGGFGAGSGGASGSGTSGPASVSGGGTPTTPGVTVEASGTVGAFDFSVISVDASFVDPTAPAIDWLTTNGYTVSPGAPGLIRPYLVDGLRLLALKLVKGADTGSIRPLMLTYEASKPMIPIKLTAVAANKDMGVMAWLLSDSRSVPQNYLALELNEARINWFNASSNYNDVVTAAADEASGQGFVTEFARPSSALSNVVWSSSDEAQWQTAQHAFYSSFQQIFDNVYAQWGQWDGFWDAMRGAVTLPPEIAFADFQFCPDCYAGRIQFTPSALFAAIQAKVIQPVKDVQALLDKTGYVTRLYTTMSPEEMTVDPLFTFNASLPEVSNVHTAVRVIECNPSVTQFDAPWRIELPQGGIVRGTANQVGTWPTGFDAQPATNRIVRTAASGAGDVVEDNTATIGAALRTYNAGISPAGGGGGSMGGAAGTAGAGTGAAVPPESSGGCSTAAGTTRGSAWVFAGLAALAWVSRRRRS